MLRTPLCVIASFSLLASCSSEPMIEGGDPIAEPIADPIAEPISEPADETLAATEPTEPVEVAVAPTEVAPVPTEVAPVPTEVAPVPTEVAPVPTEVAPVPTEVAPVPTEVAPVPTEVAPVPTEVAPVPTEVAPVPTEVAPVPTEVAPVPAPTPQPRIDVEFVGEDVFVSIGGQRVAKEHLRRTADAMEIIGTTGQILQTIPIPQPKDHPPVMIGVRFETPGRALAKQIGQEVSNYSLVVAVMEGGPGFLAGLEDFDLVTAVDGKVPATPTAIRDRLKSMAPGESIVLTVRRGSASRDFSLQSQAWKHVPLPASIQPPPLARNPSPVVAPMPGTPNAPSNTGANGRPAAAPQRSATPNP